MMTLQEDTKRHIIQEYLKDCDPDQLHDGSYLTIIECMDLMENYAQSKVREARNKAIDECSAIVRSRQDCFLDSVDPLVDELLNLKEKS